MLINWFPVHHKTFVLRVFRTPVKPGTFIINLGLVYTAYYLCICYKEMHDSYVFCPPFKCLMYTCYFHGLANNLNKTSTKLYLH